MVRSMPMELSVRRVLSMTPATWIMLGSAFWMPSTASGTSWVTTTPTLSMSGRLSATVSAALVVAATAVPSPPLTSLKVSRDRVRVLRAVARLCEARARLSRMPAPRSARASPTV